MKPLRLTSLAFLLCLATACSPIKIVNQQAVDQFALAAYQTYDFLPEESQQADTLGEAYHRYMNLFRQEVEKQLAGRGLTRDKENPDLLFNLGIVVEEKAQTRQTNFLTDAPRYIGQRRYTWKSQEVEISSYKEGTISMHLIDKATNELVWQGEAEAVIPKKEEVLEERIREGVSALFDRVK